MPFPHLLSHAASVVIVAGLLTGPALTGPVHVVDGDTIRMDGKPLRLSGIDAPELAQLCGGASCGVAARAALQRLTYAKTVTCVEETRDRYKRIVARCVVDGVDIAAAMTRAGHALAYRQYGSAYVAQEDEARLNGAGIWAGEFEAPWDWRRAKREGRLNSTANQIDKSEL